MKLTVSEILKITSGSPLNIKNLKEEINGFDFDSRRIKEGFGFIPLKGQRDGHEFIKDAIKKGATLSLSEKETDEPTVIVKNTFEAFKKIAEYKRNLYEKTVIGITGSVGKTTTKELLNFLLSKYLKVYSSIESYNNEIGVSYTLSNLDLNSNIYIQEIGTNKKGEIPYLTKIVKPEIAIVTEIAPSHLEGFKNFEELTEEKLSLLQNSTVKIAPHKFKKYLAKDTVTFGKYGDGKIIEMKLKPDKTLFTVEIHGEKLSGETSIPGKGIVNTVIISLLVAKQLDLNLKEIMENLENFSPPKWRMEINGFGSTTLIEDYYNANPKSMENSIEVLSIQKGKKIAILGDMLELGKEAEKLHKNIGEILNEKGIDTLLSFGNLAENYTETFKGEKRHFKDREAIKNFLKNINLKNSAILIKGSRGNRLEKVGKFLKEELL